MEMIKRLFNKPIEFECIYKHNLAMEKTPAVMANKQVMADAKNIENLRWPARTLKQCPAFFYSKKFGFLIRSPYSIRITLRPDRQVKVELPDDGPPPVTPHESIQHLPFLSNRVILKIEPEFGIREKTGVPCFYRGAWQMNKSIYSDFVVPSGYIDFKYNNTTNIFIALPVPEHGEKVVTIRAGDPMVHIIPLTEREINLSHRVDPDFRNITHHRISFDDSEFIATKRLMKKNDELRD